MGLFALLKTLKTYEDYVYKANTFENLFMREKAIDTMTQAVRNQRFTKEDKSSGYIYLGILYYKMKNYAKASDCYHQGFELMIDENFFYRSPFKQAIDTFIRNEDKERAQFWLTNLLQRQSYDKKFRKLTVLKKKLL